MGQSHQYDSLRADGHDPDIQPLGNGAESVSRQRSLASPPLDVSAAPCDGSARQPDRRRELLFSDELVDGGPAQARCLNHDGKAQKHTNADRFGVQRRGFGVGHGSSRIRSGAVAP